MTLPLVDGCPCMDDRILMVDRSARVHDWNDLPMDSTPSTRSAAPRRPNARGQGELLREEIVSCAVHMLDELADDEALSLRAVARALSISPTSVYLYFPDRDALVLAAMQRCHAEMLEAADGADAAHQDPALGLRARILAQAAWGQGHAGIVKVWY